MVCTSSAVMLALVIHIPWDQSSIDYPSDNYSITHKDKAFHQTINIECQKIYILLLNHIHMGKKKLLAASGNV